VRAGTGGAAIRAIRPVEGARRHRHATLQILSRCANGGRRGAGYEAVGWFGLLAPPNTPPAIVKEINAVVVAAMQTKGFRDHLATLGADPKPQTPEEFARYINADVAKWSRLVKDNNVQLPGGK